MAVKNPKLAQRIRDSIKKWDDWWKYNRDQYYELSAFVLGDQWRDDEAEVFKTYKKIPLTANHLAPLMNHLLGEQRQNTPNLQVVPDNSVPEETAEVREALIKEISLNSHAATVYQTAFQQAAIGGFGAYCLSTEYDNNENFDQNIILMEIRDPCKAFWDIAALSPCKTDGMFSGKRTKMSREKFAKVYGKKLERSIGSTGSEDNSSLFSDDDSITIIDWYERKYKNDVLYQLSNGRSVNSKEFDDLPRVEVDGKEMLMYLSEPVTVITKRNLDMFKVVHKQLAGDYVLEETDFPSRQLPVIFVDQNSYWDKQGRQICRPFLKDAKDSQRYINYIRTQCAYILKVSRYDQFMASKQNVKSPDTMQAWRNPQVVLGALLYDESPNGNKPERLEAPELSRSLTEQYQIAVQDIQNTTGMYDTQMGQQGNEISGDAIDARTKRGSYNTYVPFNSLNRAIAVGGEIIDEMIPKVYDTQRTMKLNLPNKGTKDVTLNEQLDEYGGGIKHDMSQGSYKIRLLPGPSLEGQKAENLQSMQTVINANPELFADIMDLFVENLPMANNIEMRNRLRAKVSPAIIKAGKTGEPLPPQQPQQDPRVMIEMQKLQLQQQDLERKQKELQLKSIQSHQDMTIEWEKLEAEKQEAAAKLLEMKMRYQAESERNALDAHTTHANNLVKILTHHPRTEKHANE